VEKRQGERFGVLHRLFGARPFCLPLILAQA